MRSRMALCAFGKNNAVDDVMPVDRDFVVLSVSTLCYNVNFKDKTFKVHKKEIEMLDEENNPSLKYDAEKWPIIGAMLG